MEKTLMMSLENHHIYYVTDTNISFYMALPYKKYTSTNITIELRDDTMYLAPNVSETRVVMARLSDIYTKIDNYNVSLIIPLVDANFLANLDKTNSLNLYTMLDNAIAKVINCAYTVLNKGGIKVESDIVVIDNKKYVTFTNWFMEKYKGRSSLKSIAQMISYENMNDNLDKVELSDINFVIGKEKEEEPIKIEDPNLNNNLELDSNLILNEIDLPEDDLSVKKEAHQAGYISYYLLGVISIGISLVLLYILL